MALVLTEEQELLGRTARELVAARSPLKRIRQLRDARDPIGFSRDLWREMARLGWAGILIPEAHGGAGLGYTELMVVLEELGRGLVPEPMLSTVLLGASALLLALAGCGEASSEHCPNGEVYSEGPNKGQCVGQHREQVNKELKKEEERLKRKQEEEAGEH